MGRGRKPDSAKDQILKMEKKRRAAPKDPAIGTPSKPETVAVDPVASAEWDRIVPVLEKRGVLSQADLGILVCYVDAYSRLVACRKAVAEDGVIVSTDMGSAKAHPALTAASIAARDLRSAAEALGATPASQSSIVIHMEPEENPLEAFLKRMPTKRPQ